MKFRKSTLRAALFLTLSATVLFVPAYAQQEVAPNWYDPWAASPKPASTSSEHKVAEHKNVQEAKHQARDRRNAKKESRGETVATLKPIQETPSK